MCPRRLGSMRGNQGNTMEIKDPVRGFVAVLLLLSCLSTGGVEAAGQVPVESFVARQTFDDPRISSGGSYVAVSADLGEDRSEEHTSELQSLMRISYAVFCLKKKKKEKKRT